MRVAIISDIHANRQALEAVLEQAGAARCDEVWCLGDIVGYGADPEACVGLIRAHADLCLAGNHDLGVTGALSVEAFSDVARRAAIWTAGVISARTREFLASLAPAGERDRVSLYHGSPRDPVWEYVIPPQQAELAMAAQEHRISLVGHTHVPVAFQRRDGERAVGGARREGEQLELGLGRWLLNPGSVGQPRDGDPRAAWLELDADRWTASFRRVGYDVSGAARAIRAAGLPEALAERLHAGQ